MESESVVIYAERQPMAGIAFPGPHQIYRNPRISVEKRYLGNLHPDEVRVEMAYAGVCGTDVHLVESNPETGYIRSSAPAVIPPEGRIIGHEGVGRVIATGTNVHHISSGAYITFESIIVCHYCDMCRKGRFNQCHQAKLLGLEKDGIFATIADIPAVLVHDVTALIKTTQDLRAFACVEPAGVAYVACQNTRVAGGDKVIIFGGGPIGLFCAILAKTVFGAAVVNIVEPIEFRRQLAAQWCDQVYDVEEFFDDAPKNIDVVIEACGYLSNVTRIFRHMNANGRIALLARSGTPLILDAVDHMITNAVSIMGSRGHLGGAFIDLMNLYQQHRIPLDAVVTSVVNGVTELGELLKSTDKILQNNCKALIKF